MKKIYTLLSALVITGTSFGQTIDNSGFETWRTGTAGMAPAVAIQAPNSWASFDSLAIAGLQAFGAFLFDGYTPTDLHAQLFQETNMTHVHGGSSSAKLVSVKQDTAGILPGTLANANPGINLGGTSFEDFLAFTGGTPTNLRITSVTAYIKYYPGKDSVTKMFGGNDSGTFVVQASSAMSGTPTIVGSGSVTIGATSTFTPFTVNLTYTDMVNFVDSVRIIFSSGRGFNNLDSSIMYVDDVSMTGVPQVSVKNVAYNANLVKVYPNPTSGIINLAGPQNDALTCELISVSGQVVAAKAFNGRGSIDVTAMPAGLYFYNITDASGTKVQTGKVTVAR